MTGDPKTNQPAAKRGLRDAVARAIYEARNGAGCKPWARQNAQHQAPYLSDADAALRVVETVDVRQS